MKLTRKQLRLLIIEGMRDIGKGRTRELLRSDSYKAIELVGTPDMHATDKRGLEYIGGEVQYKYRFDIYSYDSRMEGLRQIGTIPVGLDFNSREEAMAYYNSPQFEREFEALRRRHGLTGKIGLTRF